VQQECAPGPPQRARSRTWSHFVARQCKRRQELTMQTLKRVGFVSAATLALAISAPTTLAETAAKSKADNPGSVVHRVSHNLANTQQYTGTVNSGNKWAKESAPTTASKSAWATSATEGKARSGYKWSTSSSSEQSGSRWRSNTSEQTGSRWRSNTSEQTGSRWRSNTSEQTGSRWRSNTSEQTGSRWRSNTSEQTGSRWRSNTSEQTGSRWRSNSFEQTGRAWRR
jgi:heme oxygenase